MCLTARRSPGDATKSCAGAVGSRGGAEGASKERRDRSARRQGTRRRLRAQLVGGCAEENPFAVLCSEASSSEEGLEEGARDVLTAGAEACLDGWSGGGPELLGGGGPPPAPVLAPGLEPDLSSSEDFPPLPVWEKGAVATSGRRVNAGRDAEALVSCRIGEICISWRPEPGGTAEPATAAAGQVRGLGFPQNPSAGSLRLGRCPASPGPGGPASRFQQGAGAASQPTCSPDGSDGRHVVQGQSCAVLIQGGRSGGGSDSFPLAPKYLRGAAVRSEP
jgi:hypothetical protein